MVDNKQLISTAATVHCTLALPFCFALCSVDLLGSVVAEEHDLELEIGDGGVQEKSWCKRRLRLLGIVM